MKMFDNTLSRNKKLKDAIDTTFVKTIVINILLTEIKKQDKGWVYRFDLGFCKTHGSVV